MPTKPLVSILTPSFNQAEWLEDNLRSVACQTYPAIEHIVMDGGSTDGSPALLERGGPCVHWRSEPDRGQAHALNKAFSASRGDIIGWLNSDDAYFDTRVVTDVVSFFVRNPGVDLVYGHAAYVDADGRLLHYFWAPPFHERLLRLYDFIIQPAAFFRRAAIREPFVDETMDFAMDHELWLRLAGTHRLVRFDRVIAIDRAQPDRKSVTQLHKRDADQARLRDTYGITVSRAARSAAAAHHVYCRLRGTRLALGRPEDLAFPALQDGRAALLRRQIGQRRAKMSR